MYRRMTAEERTKARSLARSNGTGARERGRISLKEDSMSSRSPEPTGALLKECPVCHAVTFSDMDVCYGCLHVFEGDQGISEKLSMEEVPGERAQSSDRSALPLRTVPCVASPPIVEDVSVGMRQPEGLEREHIVDPSLKADDECVKVMELVIGIRLAQDACDRVSARVEGQSLLS